MNCNLTSLAHKSKAQIVHLTCRGLNKTCDGRSNTKLFVDTFERIARERKVQLGKYMGVVEYDRRMVEKEGIEAMLCRERRVKHSPEVRSLLGMAAHQFAEFRCAAVHLSIMNMIHEL